MSSDRTAELTLLLRAKDLGASARQAVAGGLDGVARTAGRLRESMAGLGQATAVGLGMAAETLASGGSVLQAASQLGLHMVSELTETFGGQLIAKFTSSTLLATIMAPISALGTAIGGFIAAAIPAGMALLPVILIGAIVAAVAVLILNPEIRDKVFAFVGELIGNIVKFLGELPGKLVALFSDVWTAVTKTIGPFVGDVVDFLLGIPAKLVELGGMIVKTIIDGLISLPGKIADVIREAFLSLRIDVGPFHISAAGVKIDLPSINAPTHQQHADYVLRGQVPHYQHGGIAGLRGPELAVIGEREPELVTPLSRLTEVFRTAAGGGTPVILAVDGREIARVIVPSVSRELYYELVREAPSSSPA